jgi:protein-tyrosine-phosphatase
MYQAIFACVHNAGRSQMVAAFFKHHADPSKARCSLPVWLDESASMMRHLASSRYTKNQSNAAQTRGG